MARQAREVEKGRPQVDRQAQTDPAQCTTEDFPKSQDPINSVFIDG
jgi:hypothetical protein